MRKINDSHNLIQLYAKNVRLSEKYSIYRLWKFARNKDASIRSDLAKALVFDSESEAALEILCKLAKDTDELVRVEAIDSLSEFIYEKSYVTMKKALLDSDYLVRKYAALGLAWVGKELLCENTKKVLLHYIEKEKNLHGKVGAYEGLYILGCDEYLDKLIELFGCTDYQIQCSVINALYDIVDEGNVLRIQKWLNIIDRTKYPISVNSSIENLDSLCQSYGKTDNL